ncbi:hypothetical protein [Neorickettsia findlayensis]|uniref:Uncharacterized protein n=1 Tax=Neorickettsia findlayensis TaxID=2686014 RepID=A0A6P1GAK6_9RICK|nr:hypothetical protein [Neorickettsia findlayensis]QHD64961.1 hypothetical protein GP480_00545 [Neorickettsia findlayensis]
MHSWSEIYNGDARTLIQESSISKQQSSGAMPIACTFSKRRILCIFALSVLLLVFAALIVNLTLLCSTKTFPNGKILLVLNILAVLFTFLFFLCCTASEIARCAGLQGGRETPKSLDLTGIVSDQPVYVPENTEIHNLSLCGSVKLLGLVDQIVDDAITSGLQAVKDRQTQEKTPPDHAQPGTPFPTVPENPVIQLASQRPPGRGPAAELTDYQIVHAVIDFGTTQSTQ